MARFCTNVRLDTSKSKSKSNDDSDSDIYDDHDHTYVFKTVERKYKCKWLLGIDGSKRRRCLFILKCALAIYTILNLYGLQRWGLLLHGKSFYLPYHESGHMRKTGMSFRNLFYSVAKRPEYAYTHSEAEKAIFFPTDDILELSPLAFDTRWTYSQRKKDTAVAAAVTKASASASSKHDAASTGSTQTKTENQQQQSDEQTTGDDVSRTLGYIDDVFRAVSPSDVFEAGEKNPFVKVSGDTRRSFRNNPVTLIIFPGILSEMIETTCFSDVDRVWGKNTSVLAREWHTRLSECRGREVKENGICDRADTMGRRWSLHDLDFIAEPLEEMVTVGSIDAAEDDENNVPGTPLVRLVRLNALMGSLETVGTVERSSKTYLRRLTKVFNVIGEKLLTNVYLFGYSRGATIALDVLVRARKNLDVPFPAYPWAKNIKGVVSVGGVLYGTEAADTVIREGHLHKELIEALLSPIEEVNYKHEGDFGTIEHMKEIASNTQLFVQMGIDIVAIGRRKEVSPAMALEFGQLGLALPDFSKIATMMKGFLFRSFRIMDPVSEYYENVRKFKIVMAALSEGIVSLSTQRRIQWWKKNIIPSDVRYYGLAATMSDVSSNARDVQNHLHRHISYQPNSADFRTNRAFFYDLYNATALNGKPGKQLNDGQVCADRAFFWPSLNKMINPNQPSFQGTFLGIIGAHHWSIALPSVFDKNADAFPRDVLLETLATYLAMES